MFNKMCDTLEERSEKNGGGGGDDEDEVWSLYVARGSNTRHSILFRMKMII